MRERTDCAAGWPSQAGRRALVRGDLGFPREPYPEFQADEKSSRPEIEHTGRSRFTAGETMEAIAVNPNVAAMLRKPESRAFLQFSGRARVVTGGERDKDEQDTAHGVLPAGASPAPGAASARVEG